MSGAGLGGIHGTGRRRIHGGECDEQPWPCRRVVSGQTNALHLIYFVHQFKPTFREAALLDDSEMLAAVTVLNHQIVELAPVLNSPTMPDAASVRPENVEVPIALMVK